MAITAYSKTFKKELDVKQIQNLYRKSKDQLDLPDDFKAFIEMDIECSCCNVGGARIVKEGYSTKIKGQAVRQSHFAFKKNNGEEAHLVFCDHYKGEDQQVSATGDSNIRLSISGSEVTKRIRDLICTAITHEVFSQADMRNMRQWFLDLRSKKDFFVENVEHQLNVLAKTIARSKRHDREYVVDKSLLDRAGFDINREVYESLSMRFPYLGRMREFQEEYYFLARQQVVKRAIAISKKDHGLYAFDRDVLEEKYISATRLSMNIIKWDSVLGEILSSSVEAARKSNPIMAYSALLLFVSDWDHDEAKKKHFFILEQETADNTDLGNMIGLNPFIHYDAWLALKYVLEWKQHYTHFDFEQEFLKEKERLKEIYNI